MPPNRERLSVAVRIRADRTFPAAVAIAGAVSGNQALPSGVVAIVLLEEVSEAVKRGNKVAVAVRAVRARVQAAGAVGVVAAVAAEVAAVAAVAVAAEVVDAGRDGQTA